MMRSTVRISLLSRWEQGLRFSERRSRHRANTICERLLGSVRRECLAHILGVSEADLRRVLKENITYCNHSRPHQGINQQVPEPEHIPAPLAGDAERGISFPVLGGLHLIIGNRTEMGPDDAGSQYSWSTSVLAR